MSSFRGPHSLLEDLVHAERGLEDRILDDADGGVQRDGADDLRCLDLDPAALRLIADHAEDFPDVRDAVIGQVHRHLDQAAVGELEAERLDVGQAAGRRADRLRDVLRDLQVRGLEVDVVSDQRDAGAHGGRAGAGVDLRGALVWRAVGVSDMVDEVLEAALPNLLELAALDATRGFAVVVDRDVELLPETRPERVRQVGAEANGKVGKRHKGDNVGRAHSRMLATVPAQVDAFRRDGGAGHRRIDGERRLGHEGDHHAVVGSVGLDVYHAGARRFDRIGDGGDDFEPPAFREIRDALYKGSQTAPPTTVRMTRFTPT